MIQKEGKKIIIKSSWILLWMGVILPYLVVSIYSRPCADDYAYSSRVYHLLQSGQWNILDILKKAFETSAYFYNHWQGLYTSAFVLSLQPGVFGEKFYFLGAVMLCTMLYISIVVLIGTLKKLWELHTNIWLDGLILFAVILQGMPSVLQGIYWFNGAWNYTFYITLILFECAFCIKGCMESNRSHAIVYCVITSIMAFQISGGNHVTSALNIGLLFLANIMCFIKRYYRLLWPFMMGVLGFGIMYVAPGTAIRKDALVQQNIPVTFARSTIQAYVNILRWMDIKWIALLIITLPLAIEIRKRNIAKTDRIHPLFTVILSFFIIAGMYCVPFYAMGNFGDKRLKNVVWITFILLSLVNWFYFWIWCRNETILAGIDQFMQGKAKMILAWVSTLIIVLNVDSNVVSVTRDLITGDARKFAEECDMRYRYMDEPVSDEVIIVPTLPEVETLKFSDITDNPEDWRNVCWAEYYGKMMVTE